MRVFDLRLWLCWVFPKGHTVPLDFIEALFTKMIPVDNKAILGELQPAYRVKAKVNRWQRAVERPKRAKVQISVNCIGRDASKEIGIMPKCYFNE